MNGFVIIVDFHLNPGAEAAFRPLVVANAAASIDAEPGCRRFDVLAPEGEPDRILLYEIYDDEAAFDVHCRSTHFAEFDRESAPMVRKKLVTRCRLVAGDPAAGTTGAQREA